MDYLRTVKCHGATGGLRVTNLLQRATCVERFALPVAVDADISQLHFLLDVADQSFGVHQVLHIRYEKPGSSMFEKRHGNKRLASLVKSRNHY